MPGELRLTVVKWVARCSPTRKGLGLETGGLIPEPAFFLLSKLLLKVKDEGAM